MDSFGRFPYFEFIWFGTKIEDKLEQVCLHSYYFVACFSLHWKVAVPAWKEDRAVQEHLSKTSRVWKIVAVRQMLCTDKKTCYNMEYGINIRSRRADEGSFWWWAGWAIYRESRCALSTMTKMFLQTMHQMVSSRGWKHTLNFPHSKDPIPF